MVGSLPISFQMVGTRSSGFKHQKVGFLGFKLQKVDSSACTCSGKFLGTPPSMKLHLLQEGDLGNPGTLKRNLENIQNPISQSENHRSRTFSEEPGTQMHDVIFVQSLVLPHLFFIKVLCSRETGRACLNLLSSFVFSHKNNVCCPLPFT